MILLLLLQSAAAPAPVPVPPAPVTGSGWTVVSKLDPATHLGSLSASARTADGKARLVVRCDRTGPGNNAVSVQFIPKPAFIRASARPVSVQADGGPILGTNWEFPGGGAFTAQEAVVTTLTVAIAHAKSIKVRVIDPTETPIEAVFDGPGSEAPIRQALDACGYVFGQMPAPPPPPPADKPADPEN